MTALEPEEWTRRTRENVEACDAISRKYGLPLISAEDRAIIGRMVGKQMQCEKLRNDEASVVL